jgi:intein/homing endonuclease
MLGASNCNAPMDPVKSRETAAEEALVPWRVEGTVRRQTHILVHIETEYDKIITTPEHPFAVASAGYLAAKDLSPGDLLVSGKGGTLPVSSVRIEFQTQPVEVFNLSVEGPHAYVVGADEILVHNVNCKDKEKKEDKEDDVSRKTKEIAEAEQELDALRNTPRTSPAHDAEINERIATLGEKITRLKALLARVRYRQ